MKLKKSRMYENTKTWNPFVGCKYDCIYCKPSFQAQLKRLKHRCYYCYEYIPHAHPERLNKIPPAPIVFVAGTGDISFSPPEYTREIIKAIKHNNETSRTQKIFYFQSKNPIYFKQFLSEFPENVFLLTTLETNRDTGYRAISKAPLPSKRYRDFLSLDWPNKVVTIEPILDFDLDIFVNWLGKINPKYVWIGYNTVRTLKLPEPPISKTLKLIQVLDDMGIPIKLKHMISGR